MEIYRISQASSLPQAELEKARAAMKAALLPRDQHGNPLAVVPTGPGEYADSVGPVYYPYIIPDEQGCVPPLVRVEDFAYGRTPPYLGYAPGREKVGCLPFDGTNLGVIAYDNPQLNLSPVDQYRLQQASLQLSASGQSVVPPGPIPPYPVWETPYGMVIQHGDETELLSNFTVRALTRRVVKQRDEADVEEFTLQVYCHGESRHLTVKSTELENIVPTIVRFFPACHTDADASKASARIANAIRDQIPTLPTVIVVKSPGFICLRNRWVYAHDGMRFDGSVEFRTGCTIPCNPEISPREALKAALGLLELAEKSLVMLPLLLLAHQGFLFNLFEAAGVTPKAPVFLNGETGSFKTSLAQAIFRPFMEQPASPEASFRDTKTALEVKIGAACSRTLVVDDFQPPVTATAGRELLEKLEMIVRLFGDGIAKSRSNAELGRAKEFHPAGCCLITGEDTGGSHSTLLRCLILPLQKGDISSDRLRFYQDHPEYLRTHWFYFLEWAGINGDTIVKFIQEDFQCERLAFAKSLSEPRQIDIGVSFMVVAKILLQYMQVTASLDEVTLCTIEQRWRSTLVEVLRRSEEATVELDPVRMYLEALFDAHITGKLQIASSQSEFKCGCHAGFVKGDSWWLLPPEVYSKVIRFWQEQKVVFPLKPGKVHALLAQAGLTDTALESRGGKPKTLYIIRSTLEGRPRMLVLHVEQARLYLESNEK